MDLKAHHYGNHQKANDCFAQLQAMDLVPKSKMFKIYRNVSKAWVELDKEFVNCRRTKHITPKYTDLEKQLAECITVFEQWAVMAALMY